MAKSDDGLPSPNGPEELLILLNQIVMKLAKQAGGTLVIDKDTFDLTLDGFMVIESCEEDPSKALIRFHSMDQLEEMINSVAGAPGPKDLEPDSDPTLH